MYKQVYACILHTYVYVCIHIYNLAFCVSHLYMYLNLNIWVYVDACILTHEYVGSMYVHVFKKET